jgi:sulfur-oxidizing protein SoxA
VTIKLRRTGVAVLLLPLLLLATATAGSAAEQLKSIPPQDKDNPLRELISGYQFSPLELRSLQDDDFDNPAFAWSTQGEKLWSQVEGTAGESCASCHNAARETMRGVAASYPKYDAPAQKVINLEQRINICRTQQMKAAPWAYESDALLAMTAFVRLQSRRSPTNVRIDGPAAKAFALGQKMYTTRTGFYGMSCALCHNDRYGSTLHGETISQGHPNGMPVWQTSMKKLVSLHERFKSCYRLMRAEPFASGSPEFVALELYVTWRANGLPLEAPAVRR